MYYISFTTYYILYTIQYIYTFYIMKLYTDMSSFRCVYTVYVKDYSGYKKC